MLEVITIILIIALAGLAFNLQTAASVKMRRTDSRRRKAESVMHAAGEQRTIDLIGEKTYKEMTERIDDILQKHSHQQCMTLNLTCGPDTKEGAAELHSLLPGTQLQLNQCTEGGVDWIDVYAAGARIGRLALLEASSVREISKANYIRGAYVAEQNCYGIEDSHRMALIIFYESKSLTRQSVSEFFFQRKPSSPVNPGKAEICEN